MSLFQRADGMPFLIAELSCNHRQDKGRLFDLVRAAKDSGADAVKLQTFLPERMAGPDTVMTDGPWAGRNLRDLYAEAQTPWEWHAEAFALARSVGLLPFSTPGHVEAVDFLETLDCPAYKVASFENEDDGLLYRIGQTARPVLVSTGMHSGELSDVWRSILRAGHMPLIVPMHCVSAYPCPWVDAGLGVMTDWNTPPFNWRQFGFSDHTDHPYAGMLAVAAGATVFERHLTLGGQTLDHDFSDDPPTFRTYRDMLNAAALAMRIQQPHPLEAPMRKLKRPTGGLRGDLA